MTFTKVLVSVGGTREPWDEVRFLGNRSTRHQGYEIARAAVQARFEATLIAANVEAALLSPDVTAKSVKTAVEMLEVMQEMAPYADVIIMCATVADFRPKPVAGKLLWHDNQIPTLELERTPDILQHLLMERRPGQAIIGFGAFTGTEAEVRAKGAVKARHKQADLLAVNQVGADKGFATPTNTLFFFDRDGQEIAVISGTKFVVEQYLLQLADKISQNWLDWGATSKTRIFTSESVTEGHPNKACDRISDSILDAILEQDPKARVAVETFTTTGLVYVMDEVTTEAYVEIPHIVRHETSQIGHTSSDIGFDGRSYGAMVSLNQQSPDISAGVSHSLETRGGQTVNPLEAQDAGDQGLMFGYTSDETPDLMPMPIWVVHKLAARLVKVRKESIVSRLRPDGKTQVSVVYEGNVPRALSTVVVSTQRNPDRTQAEPRAMVEAEVIEPVFDSLGVDVDISGVEILVNPSGNLAVGDPAADSGLTERELTVDTYGGMARHGGGTFSGKDPSKVDRSASYTLRWIAKNTVAAGLAKRCEVQISYAVGRAHPVSLSVETFGTGVVADDQLEEVINAVFDLRSTAIICDLDLVCPIFHFTTNYGHFGREGFAWEKIDRVEQLQGFLK